MATSRAEGLSVQDASLNRSTSCRPSLPPTATISSRKALEAAGGITPFYCELCNIGNPPFFGSSQALGGHRGNSLEHKERVDRLKKEGSIILLEHEGKGKAAWGRVPAPPPPPFQIGCKVEVLYDDGEWYEGVLEQPRNANKQFLISFEDGETIWTDLPAKDVRPADGAPQLMTDENGILVAGARDAKKGVQGTSRQPPKTIAAAEDVTSEASLEEDVADIHPQASNSAGLEGGKQVFKPAKRRRFTGPRFTSKRQLKNMRRDSEKSRSNISHSQQGKGGVCEEQISTSSPEPVEQDMLESSTHSELEKTRNTETPARSRSVRLSSKVEATTCKCCRRRFNSRHALHIHIGMNSRCKTAIWAKINRAQEKPADMGISVEARDDTPPNECSVVRFKSEEVVKGKGEERGEEGRPEARWRTDFIVSWERQDRSEGKTQEDSMLTLFAPTLASALIAKILAHQMEQEVREDMEQHSGMLGCDTVASSESSSMHLCHDNFTGHEDSFERQEQLKTDREGMEQQGPLRGSGARQALAGFFGP